MVQEVVEEATGTSWGRHELLDTIDYRGTSGANHHWFVDPIDATNAFRRGDQYAIALARATGDRLHSGWLAVPDCGCTVEGTTGYLFCGVRGEGVQRVSIADGLGEILSPPETPGREVTIAATWAEHTVDLPKAVKESDVSVHLLSMSSQAKYAALLTGAAQLYPRKPSRFRGPFYKWDHAPGVLMLEELGGSATDLFGDPFSWTGEERFPKNHGLFAATSSELHAHYQPFFGDHVGKRAR